jgi:hypothetical protein
LQPELFSIGSLFVLAKDGNLDMYERIRPTLKAHKRVFDDSGAYPVVEINTPFLTPKSPADPPNTDQAKFQQLTDELMDTPGKKALVVRSRYGSGKTTFLQRLVKARNPKRVLFITYRQTLARDIMRNFGKLGFKNYLDSYDDPSVWNAPRLIVQVDSLLNVLQKNDKFISSGTFALKYDMIILDESESLLAHFDEKTMERKEISIWNFFDELLKHSQKMLLMDGDVSERSLSFASSYGDMTYISNTNAEGNKHFNLMLDETQWNAQLVSDLNKFYTEDPNFKVCIVSQSSSKAVALEAEIQGQFPHLKVKKLIGTDSGETKKEYLEDINETLSDVNVFMYSPVIESGVDITVKVKKVFGILSCKSNCQRAFLQMVNRCRCVEDERMDFLNDRSFKINNNYNFWKYSEVLELDRQTVQNTRLEFMVSDGELSVSENDRNSRRKQISVFNTVEKLNKHQSLYINYLRVLAIGKGMKFTIQGAPAKEEGEGSEGANRPKNYKITAIMEAKDLTPEEYEEIANRKKAGKTTTQENFQAEKHFWQRFFPNARTGREDPQRVYVRLQPPLQSSKFS